MRKLINIIIFALIFSALLIGTNVFAFQNIQLAQDDCLACHVGGQVDSHHALYGNVIIPDPTAAPYGTPGVVFGCLSCHEEDAGGEITEIERDCTVCHTSTWSTISAQAHQLDEAGCRTCHDSTGETIPDTHHYLYGNEAPNPTAAPYPLYDGEYGCKTCHDEELVDGQPALIIEKDCMFCHVPNYCDGLILAGNGLNPDSDADGVTALADNCPNTCNTSQLDADGDGIGDVCDDNPGCGGISCGVPQPACEESCGSEGCGA